MKVEIKSKEKNALMKRVEIDGIIDHKGKSTPSRWEVLKMLTSEIKNKENMIIIDKIFTDSGTNRSRVLAFSYDKEADIPKYRLEMMKRRMKAPKKEEKSAESLAAEEPETEEKTTEEKKEESVEEKKDEEKPKTEEYAKKTEDGS